MTWPVFSLLISIPLDAKKNPDLGQKCSPEVEFQDERDQGPWANAMGWPSQGDANQLGQLCPTCIPQAFFY